MNRGAKLVVASVALVGLGAWGLWQAQVARIRIHALEDEIATLEWKLGLCEAQLQLNKTGASRTKSGAPDGGTLHRD